VNRGVVRGVLLGLVVTALAINARALTLGGIHAYQRHLSPLASAAGYRCRFTPTCSRYAEAVIARDGVVKGGWRAVKRIARCGPWTPAGTRDVP
jgi:uncharacterized protein